MQPHSAVRAAVTAVTLLVGAGTLRAQNSLDTTFAVRGTPRLSVSNYNGDITIRGWNRSEIRVEAEYERRAGVEIDQAGTRVNVRATRRGGGEADFTITVPAGSAVEVNGMSSDVDIRGVCGEVSATTGSGDIVVTCAQGLVSIQSLSGDMDVRDVRGDLEANATSGEVRVSGVRGKVAVHVISGEIDLMDIEGSDLTAEAVSGEIRYSGPFRDNGRYRLASHSGEVVVFLAGTPNATVSVSTFSGEFDSEFRIELEPGTQVSREWQFRLGNGSARVRLESFSGSVYLKRGGGGAPREE